MSPLRDRVKAFINCPLTDTGEDALKAFLTLPTVENWNPENILGREVNFIFDFGLLFSIIGNNPSVHKLRNKVGNYISGKPTLNDSDISELHACALLNIWEISPTFIKTNNNKTPDIECHNPDGSILDIEVVRADKRHNHTELLKNQLKFTETLLPGDVAWNIACFMADASNTQELNDAFDAAVALESGESVEMAERWKVIAVPDQQLPDFLAEVRTLRPLWWPKDCPSYNASSTRFGGSPKKSSHIFLESQVPVVEYIGPIRRKAENPQNRSEHPFLIAMDSMELPRTHDRIQPELEKFFPLWNHVSGVLIFEPRFWFGWWCKEYHWSINPNPHANIPLPNNLTKNVNGVQKVSLELSIK